MACLLVLSVSTMVYLEATKFTISKFRHAWKLTSNDGFFGDAQNYNYCQMLEVSRAILSMSLISTV